MTISIEFTTIETRDAFLQETPPKGLSFYTEAANVIDFGTTTFIVLTDIVKPIALKLVAAWLYDAAQKHRAKAIAVEGLKASDKVEFTRIVSSIDLEIGKND